MDVGLVWRRDTPFSPVMNAFRNYFRGLVGTPQIGVAGHEERARS